MTPAPVKWYKNWFNSPYYHMLYNNRDEEEANTFMAKLIAHLQPNSDARILDLACGKGRHAHFIAQQGFDVFGVDLAENSIIEAQLKEGENLHFYVHDMRFPFRINYFDYVFNLFTSFGYFENDRDEINTVKSMAANLKSNGILVIDFLNAHKVMAAVNGQKESKQIESINFKWHKSIQNEKVIKEIEVDENGVVQHFKEQVHLLKQSNFESYFKLAGLTLITTFGNYNLEPFNELESDRLILIAKKQVNE